MKDLLILSAAEFEVRPLLAMLGRRGIDANSLEVGIGALEAASRAPGIATAAKGKNVVFIGTAGTFGAFTKPSLCTAGRVVWMPACERLGLGYGIPRGTVHQVKFPEPARFARELPAMTVLCSPSISLDNRFDESIRAKLDPRDCVENLELYSCARAITATAASFEVVMGITNSVGPGAHEEWKAWHEEAAEMTAALIDGLVEGKS